MDLRELPALPFRRHPWEKARADFFVGLVRRHAGNGPVSVLDVGAGDGYLARRLIDALPAGSRVTCLDAHYTAEHIERLCHDAPTGLEFTRERNGASVDWILLLDVIEHVADDAGFLGGFVGGELSRGGTALVSVPAWPMLFSKHDVMLGHHRRYRPEQLAGVIARSGLESDESGSLFSSLVLPRVASKTLDVLRGWHAPKTVEGAPQAATDVSDWKGGPFLTAALGIALATDTALGRALSKAGVNLPGLSVWTRAHKR